MLARFLPFITWLREYDRHCLSGDLVAAVIVSIMMIPQALAYALLAGLPAQVGLYASILPLIAYALFGTSRTLSVGPMAVMSLMTVAAVSPLAAPGSADYLSLCIFLALASGVISVLMGLLRLGMLANFLSHPVISGFITASGIVIAASQIKHLLGVSASGDTLPALLWTLGQHLDQWNAPTLAIGLLAMVLMLGCRRYLRTALMALGLSAGIAGMLTKISPIITVVLTTLITALGGLDQAGVKVVGHIESGLPALVMPSLPASGWQSLLVSALLISVVGFVESVAMAQTLASKRRERIDPDQELIGLGAANMASAFSGGFPVTGGLSRSIMNFDAGARTPAAGAFAAVGLAIATLTLTPYIHYLPKATLAATIIVSIMSLLDFGALKRTWRYSRSDFAAMLATLVLTLIDGVETGIIAGVTLSILLYLYRTSRPHSAIVGRVPGTEHFRNVERHEVETDPHLLSLRVDESLYFANARYLEDLIYAQIACRPQVRDLVLMCPAVNLIDASALESLEAINQRLKDSGVRLHLSEVKGPVMDMLRKSHFLDELSGKVFLSQFEAWQQLHHSTTALSRGKMPC